MTGHKGESRETFRVEQITYEPSADETFVREAEVETDREAGQ